MYFSIVGIRSAQKLYNSITGLGYIAYGLGVRHCFLCKFRRSVILITEPEQFEVLFPSVPYCDFGIMCHRFFFLLLLLLVLRLLHCGFNI